MVVGETNVSAACRAVRFHEYFALTVPPSSTGTNTRVLKSTKIWVMRTRENPKKRLHETQVTAIFEELRVEGCRYDGKEGK